MLLIHNPFTYQVLNENPEGCNQYTGPDCDRLKKMHGYKKKNLKDLEDYPPQGTKEQLALLLEQARFREARTSEGKNPTYVSTKDMTPQQKTAWERSIQVSVRKTDRLTKRKAQNLSDLVLKEMGLPSIRVESLKSGKISGTYERGGPYMLKRRLVPKEGPGHVESFPSSVRIDLKRGGTRTLAHELGHHIDHKYNNQLTSEPPMSMDGVLKILRKIQRKQS